ncbi:Ldh family oxidoreductase [Agrobacterium rhizogenes]|jgi:delta1-piperideine-2-carboxylate reductase|uniref:Ldh family oxidoreductase n=1 Tax=Rhizobium rhizogenes TaxID=359 RepID=UPI0004D3D7D6|nr:Ldh family oxidoreductase [Rhizobium rhizogenes]OCJ04570.1 lactate dehydrogenase [Agrobacterium sp. 13-626]OCJ23649.1 lactate dehydrogenase [Agrobacterium sp. B131/95]OCJ30027.1 lactate dehydrogenase [Agrobacterium sp. B133/95]KEA03262.1 lactate dehydrogenase [Rhizobium rhizogenes]MQB35058.1 Ldh family oxidoreductase [Rhizobium rhizogenes]
MYRQPYETVVETLELILTKHGYSARSAGILALNCATAQQDGSESHGLFRIKDYLAIIKSGYVNGDPNPKVVDVAPGFIRVDADNGFAQIALADAKERLVQKAAENGIAIVAIRNSHHLGALYLDVEDLADRGFVSLAVVNSIAVVAPPGGRAGVYGTNPMAFAAPRAEGPPLVFDQASSTMSHGDVQVAAREGRLLPEASGIDKRGIPTNSPHAILNGGALSTFGGHKGASIALMVEILCAALVGADFSYEVDWSETPGARSARTGETIILIDPRTGADGLPPLAERVGTLIEALSVAGQKRIPGDRRIKARSEANGSVPVDEKQWLALLELANPSDRRK